MNYWYREDEEPEGEGAGLAFKKLDVLLVRVPVGVRHNVVVLKRIS